jgi:hypothetical protein
MSGFASIDGREIVWKPEAKQALAMSCPAFEVGYGGSKGSMKTNFLAGCWLPLLQLAQSKYEATGRKQYKCRIMVFRKELKDLTDFIVKTHDIYPYFDPVMGDSGWNKNERKWHFSSGATVECHHLEDPEAHKHWNGHEIVGLGIDEAQQISHDAVRFLVANVRSGDPDYYAARMVRYTANPGGHSWFNETFHIDEYPEGGKIFTVEADDGRGGKESITRCFIRARMQDNPHLPPSYYAQLAATMNDDEIAMYLDGDFRRVAGAYFARLLRPRDHFVRSRPIPNDWQMGYAIDWGSTSPSSLHVGALDNENRLWVIDELHMPGVTGRNFGEQMAEFWKRQAWCPTKKWGVDEFYGVIDKQAMDRYGGEATAGAGIMEWGFRLFEATKDRAPGCNQMKERMLMGRDGSPQVLVFEDRCPRLCEALSKIESNAPEKPEEYDPRSNYSHAADSFRFLCMRFPVRQVRHADPRDAEVQRWERYIKDARARQRPGDQPGQPRGYVD